MTNLCKNSIPLTTTILLFILVGLISHEQQQQQHHLRFTAEAGESVCIEYDQIENTILVNCNSSFSAVVQAINNPQIVENLGDGEYLLNATLEVADGVSFEMNSSNAGGIGDLQYLKIVGENGIIVYGKILIDGVKITSWNASSNDVIPQDMNGTIRRGYIQFAASEGSQIINSEFGYLGDVEPGRRGFDLLEDGDGEEPSHDIVVRGSKFHDMWFAFYSNGAYNIVIDGNEYYNNIKYTVDPHSATHDMNITNNYIHHNRIGIICSLDCYNILIDGNLAEHNSNAGIFFSRNMTDSIARNNHIYNSSTGITVSESPNNQIYNNTIEGATDEGILLFTPEIPDDGAVTENNLVYNNTIINSENGIVATGSHDNIVENTTFFDIEESEYRLSGDSSIRIRGQHLDNPLISQDGS
ncbi:MAG: right-handed parallel beta-helix repeat-containing protein, partial [Thermoproteota archaeon]|nr:right-handed parallel beta-helix repeat-containing protein [Thermoproteota archaeon]